MFFGVFWQNPFTAQFQRRAAALNANAKQSRLNIEAAEEGLVRNAGKVERNREMIPALRFAAERFDHLGRRLILTEQFSQLYWDAYLTMSDKSKARRLSYYSGAIYNYSREMAEELSELKRKYQALYLAENKPSHLESVLAHCDQAIQMWLNKSRQIGEALVQYNETGTLPKPEEIGVSPRPKN